MRESGFILSKQVLIVFLVAGAFLGTPVRAQIIAGGPQPLLQAESSTDSWSQVSTSPTPPARCRHAMATTASGVLLFGGVNASGLLTDTWLFDSATNSWSQVSTSPMPPARNNLAMATTPSGALLFGGWGSSDVLNDTWLFNSATNSWSQLTTSPTPPVRYSHAMATTPSGVLLFGGWDGSGYINDTWRFNIATNSWSAVSTPSTPPPRSGHAMATAPSGVLLFGGVNYGGRLAATWLFGSAAPPSTVTLPLQSGWNLVSIPAVTDPSPSTVFANLPLPWSLYSWDSVNSRYLGKDTVLRIGMGFWLRVIQALDYEVAGTPYAPDSLPMDLTKGWNIVGIPYPVNINWADVQFFYGGNPYSLDQAISNQYLGAGVYHWTGSSYTNARGTVFAPTAGYWIRSLVNGASLVFHRPP